MTSTPYTISLDKDRRIAFTQRALFRMGSLEKPFEFDDMQKPRKSYAALVAWVWACLVPADAADFPTPEDLSVHIPADAALCQKLASALADAINAGVATAKNGQSSTPGHSAASS